MKQRLVAILMVALMVSGAATFLVYRMVTSKAKEATGQVTVSVVHASRALEIGTLIKDSDLSVGPWAGSIPSGMATKKEALIGRGVTAAIYAGEPVMETRLAPPGAGGGLASTIPPGMRAVAVKVNDIVGVAGFVIPGMRVDVLIAGNAPGQTAYGPQVRTILQNIEVLSAGQNFQKDNEGKPVVVPVVNLLVDPTQAETLSLASNETRIQLILRNPLDKEPANVPGTHMATLFGNPAPPPVMKAETPLHPRTAAPPPKKAEPVAEKPVAPVRQPYRIEVINGPTKTEVTYPRPPEAKK